METPYYGNDRGLAPLFLKTLHTVIISGALHTDKSVWLYIGLEWIFMFKKKRKKERKKKLQRPRRGCVKVVSCKSCFFFSFFVLSFFFPLTSIITTEGNEPGLATGVFLHLPLEVALAQLVVRGCDRLQSMLDQQSSAALSTVQFSLPTQPIRNHCGKP